MSKSGLALLALVATLLLGVGVGGCGTHSRAVSVPLDHAGLRAAPQQGGRLSLQVAMADNTTAPRGVLVWLVGGPGAPGVGLTAVIAHQFDPVVLRDYRLVLISSRAPAPARCNARNCSR